MIKVLNKDQRSIVQIAMTILGKKAMKVKKLEDELGLSTASTDALLSRAGLVRDAIEGPVTKPVHLTFSLRRTLAQGLDLYLEEVGGTADDELELGIPTDASMAKADAIRYALARLVGEQRELGDADDQAIVEPDDAAEADADADDLDLAEA